MASAQLEAVQRYIRGAAAKQKYCRMSDEELLSAFQAHDQTAFTTLLERHGKLVFAVCRRVLENTQDAEDAYQATFLLLARKSALIRKKRSLASWLHGVAYRMATNARRAAIRRRRHEHRAPVAEPSNPAWTVAWKEIQVMLDEEIHRLPEVFREAFVLCCLENMSCREVADRLGINQGTVRSRLTRARQRLQRRLSRRGVSLTALLGVSALSGENALIAVPPTLEASTSNAAVTWAAGKSLKGVVGTNVVALVQGATRNFMPTKLSLLLVAVLLISSAAAGTAIFVNREPEPSIKDQTSPEDGAPAQDQKAGLDELLSVYKELGLPLPPKDAKLVRTAAQSRSILNGESQPVVYRLVFQLRPGTKTAPPLLLEGISETERFWLDEKPEVDPNAPVPKDVDLRIGGVVLAIQCHSRGWDRLANQILEKCQDREQQPRQQLVQGALRYWTGQFLRGANLDSKIVEQLTKFSAFNPAVAPGPGKAKEEVVLTHLAGVVRDNDGQPIAGATVTKSGTYGFVETRPNSPGSGKATSDVFGRYRLSFYTRPGGSVELLGLSAQARGFVQTDIQFQAAMPVLRPGATTELDLVLPRGEVLAGQIVVPPRLGDSVSADVGKPDVQVFRVRGPSLMQTHRTESGGAFEIWVPKGSYDLELIVSGEKSPVILAKNVASGTRGLKLTKVDPPVASELLAKAFDAIGVDMARNYSYFDLKRIDWPALQERFRARAIAAGTLPKFVDVLGEMLSELDDGHIWFGEPADAIVPRRHKQRPYNGNFQATEATLDNATMIGNGFARVGTTKSHGFGVVRITRQSRADHASVQKVVEFIRSHADAPGFLVDLRDADGGNELLAQPIASEFCAAKTLYAKSKFRNGPQPTDFGPVYDRFLEASSKPFTKPVVCILGPGCVSSGEGFAQMLVCLPQVTSLGMPTRGSSGNPRPFKLPGLDVTVMYSRWVDMMPDGSPIEGRGVQPSVLVDLPPAAYQKSDPTWDKAMEVLRAKVKGAKESHK